MTTALGTFGLPPASTILPEPFALARAVAATLKEGVHYEGRGAGEDWTSEGYAALRDAGWDGTVRTLPDVADALNRRPAAIVPLVASPPTPSPTAAAPIASAPLPTITLDVGKIMARSKLGDRAFAAAVPAGPAGAPVGPVLEGATSIADLSGRFWARRHARISAGLCPVDGSPKAKPARAIGARRPAVHGPGHAAPIERLAAAQGGLPEPADVYARRRGARPAA